MQIGHLSCPPPKTAVRPLEPLASMARRLETFGFLLDHFWPEPDNRRMVDLGAGHGLFSRMAKHRGFDVTAVDPRDRWTLSGAVGMDSRERSDLDHTEIGWLKGDVRTFDISSFDIVLAIGLTYHLTYEAQRDFLLRSASRPTIIDTEVFDGAHPDAIACERLRPVTVAGYEGALCFETGNVWSAADDQDSFWPTHDALLAMFADAGRGHAIVVDPPYRSRFGLRRWYVLDAPSP